MEKEKFYISTAIAYTSGKPHIGNTYEIVLADAIARYKRFLGYDVYFQTGTDEHGEKIEQKAKEAGIAPQEYVDNMALEVRRIWDVMNTSYNRFIRTTNPAHKEMVSKIFKKLYDQGDIYKGKYEGLYCTPCESFFTESQLVDGKCPDCGREVHKASEEAYFFKMSKYSKWLEEYIESHPDFIEPESRKNEIMNNFIKPGLQDLCVSRTSFTWGVPVMFDEKHVIYVWIDALSNYITFLGYDVDGNSSEEFHKYWPADIHLIGKDILRFHTIYWPIMLHALGLEMPKKIFGHPWVLYGNDKMSKSKGNIMYADDLVTHFGVDAIRYYLLHEIPFSSDGTITYDLIIERINSDLANVLGNLVNRTISMSKKYFDGIVLAPTAKEPTDDELIQLVLSAKDRVTEKMDQLRVSEALDEIFEIFRRSNKYIDETMPWVLAKDETKKERLATVLYNLVEGIVTGASLLEPFMPETTEKILTQLNAEKKPFEQLDTFGTYPNGTKVTDKPEILFKRLDIKEVMKEVEELQRKQKLEEEGPFIDIEPKDEITFPDFEKLQFQVGEIIACEEVKKSRKLLCSQVKIGSQVKQIVSGIKGQYTAEEMVGKKVMVLVNLKPAKLAGVLSEGMLLCAEDEKHSLSLIVPEKDMPPGAEIC